MLSPFPPLLLPCRALKVHATFVDNYEAAVHSYERSCDESPRFRAFVAACKLQGSFGPQSLPDLLQFPLPRISQYVRALQHIHAVEDAGNSDHRRQARALSALKRMQAGMSSVLASAEKAELVSAHALDIVDAPASLAGQRPIMTADFVFVRPIALPASPEAEAEAAAAEAGGDSLLLAPLAGWDPHGFDGEFEAVDEVTVYVFSSSLVIARKVERRRAFGRHVETHNLFVARLPVDSTVAAAYRPMVGEGDMLLLTSAAGTRVLQSRLPGVKLALLRAIRAAKANRPSKPKAESG